MGRLISYRGFRELAFVGSNADIVYAIDADLGTIFWQKHLEYSTREPQVTASTPDCPGGMTATPTMSVPGAAAPRGAGAAPAPPRGGAPAPASSFIAGTASVYAISSDGRLHRLNVSTGDDIVQPVQVLPANSRTSNLMMVNNIIYAVTSPACNLTKNAVWAIDLTVDVPKATSYALNVGEVGGSAGPVIGSDGTVYVQTSGRLLALNAGDLALKGYFNLAGAPITEVASPLVFQYQGPGDDRQLPARMAGSIFWILSHLAEITNAVVSNDAARDLWQPVHLARYGRDTMGACTGVGPKRSFAERIDCRV